MRTGAKNLEAAKATKADNLPKTKAEVIGEMKKLCNAAWVESKANVEADKKFDKATALERVAARKVQCTAAVDKALARGGKGWDPANPAAATA
jgi:hypothetical protein